VTGEIHPPAAGPDDAADRIAAAAQGENLVTGFEQLHRDVAIRGEDAGASGKARNIRRGGNCTRREAAGEDGRQTVAATAANCIGIRRPRRTRQSSLQI
jgi:hypothetical protein